MSLNLFFDLPEEEDDKDFTDYLVHCYLYYELNNPIIYDYDFDKLCKDILEKWDSLTHKYKDLVKVEDLKAGTGYSIKRYPKDIIEEAERRQKIFLQELKHEVDRVKEEEKEEEEKGFEFSNTLMETYLLCGMYRDFKHYGRNFEKSKTKAKIIRKELCNRLNNQNHREEIDKYCKYHNVTINNITLDKDKSI